MKRCQRLACYLAILVLCVAAASAEEKAPNSLDAFARRVWQLTDLVFAKHIEPPTRQQMLLAGTRALLPPARNKPTLELGQRFSQVITQEEFLALLRELIPQGALSQEDQERFLGGLCASVPGPARLVPPDELRVMEQINGNRYEGTGIQIAVEPKEKLVQIQLAFPRSPARLAGMKAGDLILEVDGVDVRGDDIRKVVKLLRGEKGTPVSVLVRQPGEKEPRKLDMIRGTIPFELIVGRRRTGEESWDYRADGHAPVAYARMASLSASTLHELRQLERRLQAEGFRALVLDLRFVNGGSLEHAALVADGLLDGGLLWRTYDRQGSMREYRADRDCLFRNWPLAVLVSGTMQSKAAMMLAAALQDNRRAVVVGEATPEWDGSVDSLVAMSDQGAIILRTGRVERARPASAGSQVKPDHLVSLTEPQRQAVQQWHMEQERGEPANAAATPEDPQFTKAVEVLRLK